MFFVNYVYRDTEMLFFLGGSCWSHLFTEDHGHIALRRHWNAAVGPEAPRQHVGPGAEGTHGQNGWLMGLAVVSRFSLAFWILIVEVLEFLGPMWLTWRYFLASNVRSCRFCQRGASDRLPASQEECEDLDLSPTSVQMEPTSGVGWWYDGTGNQMDGIYICI